MSTARAAPWAWLAAVTLTAAASHALSLRSTRAEAFLGDVRPGSRVSWSEATGAPLEVLNTGGEPATVTVSLANPPPERLLDGYEPFPDPGWARAAVVSHALEPGKSGATDITVTVPKDRSLEGRQFQLECALTGRSADGSLLRLRTRLLLAVGDGDPPTGPPAPPGWAFEVTPRSVTLPRAAQGRTSPLRGPGFAGLKLANAGEREATVRIAAVRAWPEGMSPPSGYAAAPNPRWLSGGPPVRVPAGTVRAAELSLDVPKDPRYRGKKWAFLLAADVETGGRRARTWVTVAVTMEP